MTISQREYLRIKKADKYLSRLDKAQLAASVGGLGTAVGGTLIGHPELGIAGTTVALGSLTSGVARSTIDALKRRDYELDQFHKKYSQKLDKFHRVTKKQILHKILVLERRL